MAGLQRSVAGPGTDACTLFFLHNHTRGAFRFMGMKTPIALLLAAAIALVACKSKEEKAREQALEKRADALENQADRVKDAAKDQAKVDKAAGDAQAEALKKEAERTREQK